MMYDSECLRGKPNTSNRNRKKSKLTSGAGGDHFHCERWIGQRRRHCYTVWSCTQLLLRYIDTGVRTKYAALATLPTFNGHRPNFISTQNLVPNPTWYLAPFSTFSRGKCVALFTESFQPILYATKKVVRKQCLELICVPAVHRNK